MKTKKLLRWIAWPLTLGILGLLSAKEDLPGGLSEIGSIAFLSLGFIWGAAIGFAIVSIATARQRSGRIIFWSLGFSLLGLGVGTNDHELLRPILFTVGGATVGLVVGFLSDGLVSRTSESSTRAKIFATVIIISVIVLAVVYVALNWLHNS